VYQFSAQKSGGRPHNVSARSRHFFNPFCGFVHGYASVSYRHMLTLLFALYYSRSYGQAHVTAFADCYVRNMIVYIAFAARCCNSTAIVSIMCFIAYRPTQPKAESDYQYKSIVKKKLNESSFHSD